MLGLTCPSAPPAMMAHLPLPLQSTFAVHPRSFWKEFSEWKEEGGSFKSMHGAVETQYLVHLILCFFICRMTLGQSCNLCEPVSSLRGRE